MSAGDVHRMTRFVINKTKEKPVKEEKKERRARADGGARVMSTVRGPNQTSSRLGLRCDAMRRTLPDNGASDGEEKAPSSLQRVEAEPNWGPRWGRGAACPDPGVGRGRGAAARASSRPSRGLEGRVDRKLHYDAHLPPGPRPGGPRGPSARQQQRSKEPLSSLRRKWGHADDRSSRNATRPG